MTGRIIFENEIKSCQDAAGKLFMNEGDPRTNYQKIFHILEGCKDRFVDIDEGGEKKAFNNAISFIAKYIADRAVAVSSSRREAYLKMAYDETFRSIRQETNDSIRSR